MTLLEEVCRALGITGTYLNSTIQVYVDEVVAFLKGAGIPEAKITSGLVARGVADLWNYGGAEGKLSEYFMQRAAQLALSN
jgi:hypothetical protein